MALQKQIWINSIVEGLFADNTFASRSLNHSMFVNDKKVHVPNAGSAPTIVKNRSVFPGTASGRTDYDLDYDIDEYTSDPVHIQDAEKVELSYNKRESVLKQMKSALADSVHGDLIVSWTPAGYAKVGTSGSSVPAHQASATGNRKAMTRGDVMSIKKQFDLDDIPQTGRCLLLDSVMYNQLLESLTEAQANAFLNSADAQKGTVGNIYGFDVYERSSVLRTVANGGTLASSAAATDAAAGLAWHEVFVSHALGEAKIFDNQDDPLYYGDIMSALVRAGGKNCRYDKKGVCVIYQVTP